MISKEGEEQGVGFWSFSLDFGVFATSKVVTLELIFSLIYYYVLLYCHLLDCFDYE